VLRYHGKETQVSGGCGYFSGRRHTVILSVRVAVLVVGWLVWPVGFFFSFTGPFTALHVSR
jgi:hypothetical protein